MTFTRSQFDQTCKQFIQRHSCSTREAHRENKGKLGWSWREHAHMPGFGFMERVTTMPKQSRASGVTPLLEIEEHSLEPVDCAVAPSGALDEIICRQYIVLSPTFQVPTFYFSANDSSGAPLVLAEASQIPLFRRDAFDAAEVTSCSIGHAGANFPLLSFGDHPTLDVRCWYLHPCGTSAAVDEILQATKDDGFDVEDYHLRWLEAWFTVLSTMLDFGT